MFESKTAEEVIAEAQACAERNQITSDDDWLRLGFNPWALYETYKEQLAVVVSPDCPAWRPACKALSAALKV